MSTYYRKVLAGEKESIPYRPRIALFFESVHAAILLQQIIFRWEGKKFYKFKEPCTHKLYRSGDSWTEELSFSRREFDAARTILSNEKATDLGPLVSHKTDMARLTWYELHEAATEWLLNVIYASENEPMKSANPPIVTPENAVSNGENARYYRPKTPIVTPENADSIYGVSKRTTKRTSKRTSKSLSPVGENLAPADLIEAENGKESSAWQKLVGAACEVCGMDVKLHAARAARAIAPLSKATIPATAELMLLRYGKPNGKVEGWNWFNHDWRGQKGQKPTLAQVVESWGNWEVFAPKTYLQQVEEAAGAGFDLYWKLRRGQNGNGAQQAEVEQEIETDQEPQS